MSFTPCFHIFNKGLFRSGLSIYIKFLSRRFKKSIKIIAHHNKVCESKSNCHIFNISNTAIKDKRNISSIFSILISSFCKFKCYCHLSSSITSFRTCLTYRTYSHSSHYIISPCFCKCFEMFTLNNVAYTKRFVFKF